MTQQPYLILLSSPISRWSELLGGELDEQAQEHAQLIADLRASGQLIACSPLASPSEGVLVQKVDGDLKACNEELSAETYVAGFYLVHCRDRDEAVAIASRIPDAHDAPVLIRPLLYLATIGLSRAVVARETR